MRKIRCLIVDDEPLALDLIERYVERTPFLELAGRCASAFEAMQVINEKEVDLLFLDVQMPDLDGLAFTRTLKKEHKVIFTTAFEQYALQGFKVDALDYLLKPFNYEDFLKAAGKANEWFRMVQKDKDGGNHQQYLFIKSDYKYLKIDLDNILFLESSGDYVHIHLDNRERSIMSLLSLKAVEEQLPSERFMRLHRSFLVNLEKIEAVERGQALIGATRITVTGQYKEKFQQYLSSRSV